MLDIKLIRENPDMVKSNLAKRGNPECLQMLQDLIAVDKDWRVNLTKLNELRHQRKQVTIEIAKLKKARQETDAQIYQAQDFDRRITEVEKQVTAEEQKTRDYLLQLPNLLDDSVPLGKDSNDNVEVKKWGTIPTFSFQVKNHIDLALALNQIDMERAGKVSGARFFYLKDQIAQLDMALMSFAIEELTKKGYTPIVPPYLMTREAYEGVTALGDFADVLYKVENEDLYLIATSEHPMAAMYMGEVLKEQDMPDKTRGNKHVLQKRSGGAWQRHDGESSARINSTKSNSSFSASLKTQVASMKSCF